jgi:hypothetical protein
MIDLNSRVSAASGWVISRATGINNTGQIAGSGERNGITHALRLTPATPGDLNGDFKVDFSDLSVLAQGYNAAGGAWNWESGDFTGDGKVDFYDLAMLAQHYNSGATGEAVSADFARDLAVVPEPSCAAVATLVVFGVLIRRRRIFFSAGLPRRASHGRG